MRCVQKEIACKISYIYQNMWNESLSLLIVWNPILIQLTTEYSHEII